MDAGAAGVRMEDRVTGRFRLCRGHALQVEGVNHVGRNVRLEVVQNQFLALQGPHAFEGGGDDPNVEVVARVVQVDAFHHRIGDEGADLVLDPRGFDHAPRSSRTVFNLRMVVGGLMAGAPRSLHHVGHGRAST